VTVVLLLLLTSLACIDPASAFFLPIQRHSITSFHVFPFLPACIQIMNVSRLYPPTTLSG
jgi:hypothetical protein